jgi:hypothetical protein
MGTGACTSDDTDDPEAEVKVDAESICIFSIPPLLGVEMGIATGMGTGTGAELATLPVPRQFTPLFSIFISSSLAFRADSVLHPTPIFLSPHHPTTLHLPMFPHTHSGPRPNTSTRAHPNPTLMCTICAWVWKLSIRCSMRLSCNITIA